MNELGGLSVWVHNDDECIICHESSDRLLKFADCLCTPTLKASNATSTKPPSIRVHEDCLTEWYETTGECVVCRHPLNERPQTYTIRDDLDDDAFRIPPSQWAEADSCEDNAQTLISTVIKFDEARINGLGVYHAQVVDDNTEHTTDQQVTRVVTVVDPIIEDDPDSPNSGKSESNICDGIRASYCCMPFCPT